MKMMKINVSVSGANSGAKSKAKKAIKHAIEQKVAVKLPRTISFRTVIHANKVDSTVEINNKIMPRDGQYTVTLEQGKISVRVGKTLLGSLDVSEVETTFLYETLGNVAGTIITSFIPDELKVMSHLKQAGFKF